MATESISEKPPMVSESQESQGQQQLKQPSPKSTTTTMIDAAAAAATPPLEQQQQPNPPSSTEEHHVPPEQPAKGNEAPLNVTENEKVIPVEKEDLSASQVKEEPKEMVIKAEASQEEGKSPDGGKKAEEVVVQQKEVTFAVDEIEKNKGVHEESSSSREQTVLLSDLKEYERKALLELKSKIEEAVLTNKFFEDKQLVFLKFCRYIAAEQLPVRYGGLKMDNDPDFCPDDVAKEVWVKSASTEIIEIPVPEGGKTMLWDLTVSSWEVSYKEEFVPTNEKSYTIIVQKTKKINWQEGTIRNSFGNPEPGKILVTIDNASFRKKRILYRYKAKNASSS